MNDLMPRPEIKFSFPAGKSSHIMVVDNCFSKKTCDMLIENCKAGFNLLFEPGPTMGGIDTMTKCSMDFNFHPDVVANVGLDPTPFATAYVEIQTGIASALALYRDEYEHLWRWPDIQDTGFRLQIYKQNLGFYRTHVDGDAWTPSRADGRPRVVAGVVYLNDVKEGGQTFFPTHDVEVSARAGRVVLFPTNWTHPHGGKTPLSTDKWMISTFFTSIVYPLPPDNQGNTVSGKLDDENQGGGESGS